MQSPFVISNAEGRWPNRVYFDILPGTPLWHEGTKEEYAEWLVEAIQHEGSEAAVMLAILTAIQEGYAVRLVVPDNKKNHEGEVILNTIKAFLEQA